MLSREWAKIIGFLTAAGFILMTAVGYVLFDKTNSTLLQQQELQFNTESDSRINTLKEHIATTTQTLKSYAQLPSFKSIRYYSLTLNDLAVAENIRQLELFFFDIQKNNDHLLGVRYIDNDGKEIFKVDKSAIYTHLGNISHNEHVKHAMSQVDGIDEYHVDITRNRLGEPGGIVWWVPVYVSSTKRSGLLIFDMDISLISNEIDDISEQGLTYVVVADSLNSVARGEQQLISEPLPENFNPERGQWIVSSDLPLRGLDWKIFIIGDKAVHIEGITTLQSAIKYGFLPASVVILIFLFFVFRKKVEADRHIHHLAYYDSLTGLVNRHQFDKALNAALDETCEHGAHHALIYLDLDQFKIVNDTCGHMAGDKLLEELAAYLKHSVRESDMLARLGGDEFGLLLNLCPEEMAIAIADKILAAIADFRFVWNDKSFSVGASIGVVFITNPDETSNNVLRKADLACYMAKELGRNRVHIYTDDDQSIGERHGEMQWIARIKNAIDKDLFFLVAQPIMSLSSEEASSQRYEVLIRLNEQDIVIEPGAFIPAAERYGIMPEIDRWVIEKSFSFMEKLRSSPVKQNNNIVFSVNVSGLSLGDKNFFLYIKEKFSQYNIPHESICFEITETSAITNLAVAMEFIDSIKSMGCSLALDDFGSGLCSFSYLKTIPVDFLKIDGSFVSRMLDNALDMAIVVAIKEISIATDSKVIAEFVSTPEIMAKLRELGIDYAQGYYVSRPVPMKNLFKLVDINSLKRTAGDL